MLGLTRCVLCGKIGRKKSMQVYREPFFMAYYHNQCLLSSEPVENELTRNVILNYKDVTEKLTEKNLRTVHRLRFGPTRRRSQPPSAEPTEGLEPSEGEVVGKTGEEVLTSRDIINALKEQCKVEKISFKDLIQSLLGQTE